MGELKRFQPVELRVYDDPNDPDSSYAVFLPVSTLELIFDVATGHNLAQLLAGVTGLGTCDTAAASAEKVIALDHFTLEPGARVTVKFSHANTAAELTLNVNSTGAKPVFYRGSRLTAIQANVIYEFIYNGTQYEPIGSIPGYGN